MYRGTLVSQTTSLPSPTTRILLPASLQCSRELLLLHVFVDSGADDSFIDSSLVEHSQIQLYVISSPSSPVVLGLPWLRLHNPHIDWCSASISSWSIFCHSNCLCSAATTVKPPVSIAPPSPDLFLVPLAYHDLAPVFSKERALTLPPHRPHDCAIDLLPGAPLLSSRLYNLSRPERESME